MSARLAVLALASVVLCAGCASLSSESTTRAAERYAAVIASPLRTDQDRRMDAARNPAEFLPFTGVAPGMRVLDVSTGGGYTSQLLALAVGPDGRLFAQAPNPGATVTQRLRDRPQPNFVLVARPFEDPVPPEAPPLDLVTLVLNYHDLANLPLDRAKMNQRLFAALKPGGSSSSTMPRVRGRGRRTRARFIASTKPSCAARSPRPGSCSTRRARSCAIPPTHATAAAATHRSAPTSSCCAS